MTNSQPHNGPSPKQLKYHRDLVAKTGMGFPPPKSSAQARREIKTMLAVPRETAADRRRERRAIRSDLQDLSGGAVRVQEDEVSGYSSTASWLGAR